MLNKSSCLLVKFCSPYHLSTICWGRLQKEKSSQISNNLFFGAQLQNMNFMHDRTLQRITTSDRLADTVFPTTFSLSM
jgi:hypothetical protein